MPTQNAATQGLFRSPEAEETSSVTSIHVTIVHTHWARRSFAVLKRCSSQIPDARLEEYKHLYLEAVGPQHQIDAGLVVLYLIFYIKSPNFYNALHHRIFNAHLSIAGLKLPV